MNVALASRNAERIDPLVDELRSTGRHEMRAYGCDATQEGSVHGLIHRVSLEIGVLDLMVYSVQGISPGKALDVDVSAFEECWRENCLGAFIVARSRAYHAS
jgi:short-subunit dehydrogenase